MPDCNDYLLAIIALCKGLDSLLWFYPAIWGITMISKVFSRG